MDMTLEQTVERKVAARRKKMRKRFFLMGAASALDVTGTAYRQKVKRYYRQDGALVRSWYVVGCRLRDGYERAKVG